MLYYMWLPFFVKIYPLTIAYLYVAILLPSKSRSTAQPHIQYILQWKHWPVTIVQPYWVPDSWNHSSTSLIVKETQLVPRTTITKIVKHAFSMQYHFSMYFQILLQQQDIFTVMIWHWSWIGRLNNHGKMNGHFKIFEKIIPELHYYCMSLIFFTLCKHIIQCLALSLPFMFLPVIIACISTNYWGKHLPLFLLGLSSRGVGAFPVKYGTFLICY